MTSTMPLDMNENESRIGIIQVSQTLVKDSPGGFWKALGAIEFVPDMIERDFVRVNILRYRGQSPHFKALSAGDRVPEYSVTLTVGEDGELASFEVKAV